MAAADTTVPSAAEKNRWIIAGLGAACRSGDVHVLRDMVRTFFGPDIKDIVMRSASDVEYVVPADESLRGRLRLLPLLCVSRGAVECLRTLHQLLPRYVDLDCTDRAGSPCLHVAIKSNQEDMAELLVDMGADVNSRDRQLRSPVHWAVLCLMPELLPRLAVKRADLSCGDAAGATPLHYAARLCGSDEYSPAVTLDSLRQLLRLKPSIDARDSKLRTPLMWAAAAGSAAACKILLALGADANATDSDGSTALHMAARSGSAGAATALIGSSDDDGSGGTRAEIDRRDGRGQTAVAVALSGGKTDCLLALLRLGASEVLDDSGKSIAHAAAASGNLGLVKRLQAAGCQLWRRTKGGELPVHYAVIAKSADVVCHLLSDPAHGQPRGRLMRACLHMATKSDNTALIGRLLDMGADVNSVVQYAHAKLTPLDVACDGELSACADYLRQRGALRAGALMDASAAVIQRAARRAAERRRQKAAAARAVRAAIVIQSAVRRLLAVRRLEELRRSAAAAAARDLAERQERSACILQRAMRRLVAARRMRALVEQRLLSEAAAATAALEWQRLAERSAAAIQRAWRRHREAGLAKFDEVQCADPPNVRLETTDVDADAERRAAGEELARASEDEWSLEDRCARVLQRAARRLVAAARRRARAAANEAAAEPQGEVEPETTPRTQHEEVKKEKEEEEEEKEPTAGDEQGQVESEAETTLMRAEEGEAEKMEDEDDREEQIETAEEIHKEISEQVKLQDSVRDSDAAALVLQRSMRRHVARRKLRERWRQRLQEEEEEEEKKVEKERVRIASELVLRRALRRFAATRRLKAAAATVVTLEPPKRLQIAPPTEPEASWNDPHINSKDEEAETGSETGLESDGGSEAANGALVQVGVGAAHRRLQRRSPFESESQLRREEEREPPPPALRPSPPASRRKKSRPKKGPLALPPAPPEAYRRYATGRHRWTLLLLAKRRPAESLREKVQRSVFEHESWKAIGQGYHVTHTKTLASIPNFPIISPVKFLTAIK